MVNLNLLSVFKICYMSPCSTNLAIFWQETNQKELWGMPVHFLTQRMHYVIIYKQIK